MAVSVRCLVCGKEELVIPSRANRYKTCSVQCQGSYVSMVHSHKVLLHCPICQTPMQIKPSHVTRRRTCSAACLAKLHQSRYQGVGNPNYRGRRGYPLTRLALGGKLKRVHIQVALETLGLDQLPDGYHVHHRDGDTWNNVPTNLVLLIRADHRWIHHQVGLALQRALTHGWVTLDDVCSWTDDSERARTLLTTNLYDQVGVVKPRELLEHPEEGNQQPSPAGTTGRSND